MIDPLAPQPAPKPGGLAVWPLVLADVRRRDVPLEQRGVLEQLLADMARRDDDGARKYGTHLQTRNGRNALVDAYQEALDACVYLRQEMAERERDAEVVALYMLQVGLAYRLRRVLSARGIP